MRKLVSEQTFLSEARTFAPSLTQIYRTLHRHPELAHHEAFTHQIIREELLRMGVRFLSPADNITVAVVDGGAAGAAVGLRCDTDALPVREETGLPYASEMDGVMHACGHDAHAALGLGAVRLLSAHRNELSGTFKVIFQPAEECEGGSAEVLATGAADGVDVFFAPHVWSPYRTGTLHASAIAVTAAVDVFTIVLHGRGGHGATPEKCADAVVAASALVMELQTLVSRVISPLEPAVVTVGSLHAGNVGNVIAGEAVLKGTIRTVCEETRQMLDERLNAIVQGVAAAHGLRAEVENLRLSGAVINDARAVAIANRCAAALVPSEAIQPQRTMMLGDDFADYGALAPLCYVQIGIADPAQGTDAPHHSSRFHVDESVLPLGAAWLAGMAAAAGAEWRSVPAD